MSKLLLVNDWTETPPKKEGTYLCRLNDTSVITLGFFNYKTKKWYQQFSTKQLKVKEWTNVPLEKLNIPTEFFKLLEDKSNGSYYHSWQSNIAMAFYDECNNFIKANKKRSITPAQFAEIGNRAAKRFLEQLVS